MIKKLLLGFTATAVGVGAIVYVVTVLNDSETTSIEGTGLVEGSPDTYEVVPEVQDFFDECTEKVGVITGEGGVKTNLPTTEEGYTCWYQDRSCWDFLTYSNERYKGGASGCPELNLVEEKVPLPQIVPPQPQQKIHEPKNSTDIAILPSADELSGQWKGVGVVKFSGSLYCKTADIDWTATITKISDTELRGTLRDIEGEWSGNLSATWDKITKNWNLSVNSDVVTTSNVVVEANTFKGNFSVKDAWIPCEDVTGQAGEFTATKL